MYTSIERVIFFFHFKHVLRKEFIVHDSAKKHLENMDNSDKNRMSFESAENHSKSKHISSEKSVLKVPWDWKMEGKLVFEQQANPHITERKRMFVAVKGLSCSER